MKNFSLVLLHRMLLPRNGFALHSLIAFAADATVLNWTKPQPTKVPLGFFNNFTSSISPYLSNQFWTASSVVC